MNREKFTSAFELAMMLLSLVSVCVVVAYFFVPMAEENKRMLYMFDTGICVIFIAYFFTNLFRSDDKKSYFKEHWVDLVASIPVVEQLRFARILQVIRVIRVLRMANQVIMPMLKQRTQSALALAVVLLVLVMGISAFLILTIEDGAPGSNIHSAEDALWWSLITISTVGYGDYYPVTTSGRLISGILIVCGVSLFGLISGLFATSLMSPKQDESSEELEQEIGEEIEGQTDELSVLLTSYHQQTQEQLQDMQKQIKALQQALDRQN